jgi:nitrate/nitrite transporter NarK
MSFSRDDVKRALWTLVQAFLGAFAILAPGIWKAPNLTEAKAALIAAVAAGVAAVLSVVKNWITNRFATRLK